MANKLHRDSLGCPKLKNEKTVILFFFLCVCVLGGGGAYYIPDAIKSSEEANHNIRTLKSK
jgi:hypothetical protein